MNRNFTSIGTIAASMQTSVTDVIAAAEKVGVRTAMCLNGVAYFSDTDVRRIAKAAAERPQRGRHRRSSPALVS